MYSWDCKNYLLYGSSSGVSAVQEFEVNGRTVRTFIILWVFAVEGCPQSRVALYQFSTIIVAVCYYWQMNVKPLSAIVHIGTKLESSTIVCAQLGPQNSLLYGSSSSGVSAVQGLLKYWVNERTVGTFRIVCYIAGVPCWGMSIKQGSTVPVQYYISCSVLLHW